MLGHENIRNRDLTAHCNRYTILCRHFSTKQAEFYHEMLNPSCSKSRKDQSAPFDDSMTRV